PTGNFPEHCPQCATSEQNPIDAFRLAPTRSAAHNRRHLFQRTAAAALLFGAIMASLTVIGLIKVFPNLTKAELEPRKKAPIAERPPATLNPERDPGVKVANIVPAKPKIPNQPDIDGNAPKNDEVPPLGKAEPPGEFFFEQLPAIAEIPA